jgi:hypothetical protein
LAWGRAGWLTVELGVWVAKLGVLAARNPDSVL